MFRLTHISDVHLGPLPSFQKRELLSKRITGYVNWKLNRKGSLQNTSLDALITHMKSSQPDHIAVTGDLVNLALPQEIEGALEWLQKLGQPQDVSVIPGNHDTYVSGALESILQQWAPYFEGDTANGETFPYRRNRGPVALIGSNSGRATLPFMATGYFLATQERAVSKLLKAAKSDGQFRVVMIHHPPFENATSRSKRLIGAERFRAMIEREGAELILHGHTHINSFQWIDGPDGKVPVIGVPSASMGPRALDRESGGRHARPGGRYNTFNISGKPGHWNCQFSDTGYADGSDSIQLLNQRELMCDGKMIVS